MPLDLINLPVPQNVVSLLAVSVAALGLKIYDEGHHVDTIKMMDSVSAMKVFEIWLKILTMIILFCNGKKNVM